MCERFKKKNLLDEAALLEKLRIQKIRKILAMKACRQAIMVGKYLDIKKMGDLVEKLEPLRNPWICAHGRPTMRYLIDLQEMRQRHLDLSTTWRHARKPV